MAPELVTSLDNVPKSKAWQTIKNKAYKLPFANSKTLRRQNYRQSDQQESDERPRWLACSFFLDRFQMLIRKHVEGLNEFKDSSMPICHSSRCDADENNNETAVPYRSQFRAFCLLMLLCSLLCHSDYAIDCPYSYFGVAVPKYILA